MSLPRRLALLRWAALLLRPPLACRGRTMNAPPGNDGFPRARDLNPLLAAEVSDFRRALAGARLAVAFTGKPSSAMRIAFHCGASGSSNSITAAAPRTSRRAAPAVSGDVGLGSHPGPSRAPALLSGTASGVLWWIERVASEARISCTGCGAVAGGQKVQPSAPVKRTRPACDDLAQHSWRGPDLDDHAYSAFR